MGGPGGYVSKSGLLITIDGTVGVDGSSQFDLLVKRLRDEGYDVAAYDFPQYEADSAYFVKKYLNGDYGEANALGPYTPSLFYALDRFDAAQNIKADLAANKIVISNRYVGSNMAHQATKFATDAERHNFFEWLEQLEYGMLEIPKPDTNIVLLLPTTTVQGLIDSKEQRSYTNKKRDIHEADISHLKKAVHCYELLCKTYENFRPIDCSVSNAILSIDEIHDRLWRQLKSSFNKIGKSSAVKLAKNSNDTAENPYIRKNDNGSYSITSAGRQWLESAVTNVQGNVYLTKNKVESITASAAMARLSRRVDDMRVTILDEFAQQIDSNNNDRGDEALLRRVITAYGDDSVQQLVGQHVVIEGASNLLTKKLQWGRLAAYLEQSTRYIFYDQKDENGQFKYYIPPNLSDTHRSHYVNEMDGLFTSYSKIVQALTKYVRSGSTESESKRDGAWKAATRAQACDAARVLLPVATKSTVGVFASGQALESLIMHLQSDDLVEARETGDAVLNEARKVVATFLERADKPSRGGAWIAHRVQTRQKMSNLANSKQLNPIKGDDRHSVQLSSFWPKNELDILPHLLYDQTTLNLEQLQAETDTWSFADKERTLKTYIGERLNRRHKPGRGFEIPHYSFDLICDYGIFRVLQRHRMVDSLEWQLLTPHYGYEIPSLISEAGLEDEFEACFDRSMQLYRYLLENNYDLEAQYATLLGHKMRWKFTMNAREAYHFIELRTAPQGHPGYRKLTQQIYDKIKEVHPLIAAGMIFVNKDEDPELTRLAAERATQFKLDQFDT